VLTGSLCPTKEDSGMLMSWVIVNIPMCGQDGGKRGCWGPGKRAKNGAVESEDQLGQKFASSYKQPPFQVTEYFYT
jgi:hypothetical protein